MYGCIVLCRLVLLYCLHCIVVYCNVAAIVFHCRVVWVRYSVLHCTVPYCTVVYCIARFCVVLPGVCFYNIIYIYIYMYMYINTHTHTYIYTHTHKSTRTCYARMYICLPCMHVSIYAHGWSTRAIFSTVSDKDLNLTRVGSRHYGCLGL